MNYAKGTNGELIPVYLYKGAIIPAEGVVRCLNLATSEELFYCASLSPAQAVVCAEHQSRGDYSTWDYDYSAVRYGKHSVICGDWAALI